MANIKARAKLRTGTLAAWTSANPVLLAGEPGFESDTKRLRIGDGVSAFLSLPFIEASTLSLLGLTSTVAELNKLDGATITTAELNHLAGVTSPIQTQLNTKMTTSAYPTVTSLEGLALVAGDILYATGPDTLVRLPKGAAGRDLRMNAEATAPAWGPAFAYSDVTGSRALSTDYTNSNNRPMFVVVRVTYITGNAQSVFRVDGADVSIQYVGNSLAGLVFTHSIIVPPGSTYRVAVAGSVTLNSWREGLL